MCSEVKWSPVMWRIVLHITTAITIFRPNRSTGNKTILCPVGIRIFADALANVARSNGLDPAGRSWRHGSIATRIAFLEGLERRPDQEGKFQRGVARLRIVLGVVLVVAIMLSFVTQLG